MRVKKYVSTKNNRLMKDANNILIERKIGASWVDIMMRVCPLTSRYS